MKIQFTLNNKIINEEIREPGLNLMEYLRTRGINSVKYGCDGGECGACTVLVNGRAQNACLLLMHTVNNCTIETVESLAERTQLHHIQASFLDEGAVQCGYCVPGMILSTEALHREKDNPDEGEIIEALAGNLCRCTGYIKPIKAAHK